MGGMLEKMTGLSRRAALGVMGGALGVALTGCGPEGPVPSESAGRAPSSPATAVPGPRNLKGMAIPVHQLWPLDDRALAAEFAVLSGLTVDWLRVDLYWGDIETGPGKFDWTPTKRVLAAAKAANLGVIAVVHTTPTWVRPAGSEHTAGVFGADAVADYASFCAAAAVEYRGLIDVWELWNEPNLTAFWSPSPDPVAYAALVKAASAALRTAAPGCFIISGGLGGAAEPGDVADDAFLKAAVARGLLDHVDGVGLHPYPFMSGQHLGRLQQVADARTILRAAGRPAMPLWGTEAGVPTGGGKAFSAEEQARILRVAYEEWFAMPQAGPLCWYTLRDSPDNGGYGVLGENGFRKESAHQLQGLAAPRRSR